MEMNLILVFCKNYVPATKQNFTDFFTSKEIKQIIFNHTENSLELAEINKYLEERAYTCELIDGEFKWLCCKAS